MARNRNLPKLRGVDRHEIRDRRDHQRDYRRIPQRLHEGLEHAGGLGMALFTLGGLLIFVPVLFPIWIPTAFALHRIYWPAVKLRHLPMRLPVDAGDAIDYNNPKPGRSGYKKAEGSFFIGNEQGTDEEIHAAADDFLTHMMLLGTTGAGKTEALLSIATNILLMGSGFTNIDAKGTNNLARQVWMMARFAGREDDFLIINYSTGNRTMDPRTPFRVSNTTNPYAHGTADFMSDGLVSLIPTAEGENAIFSQRAIALVKSLMIGLQELRDQGRINLSTRTIREWMTMERCMQIAKDETLSQFARDSMWAYLQSVAGFNQKKEASEQGERTLEQFGYAQAYFTRALSALTDTYGHIYGRRTGEVDFKDVVFQRRILVGVLPSMEKPPAELLNLAKILLSSLRSALSFGLGDQWEGDYDTMLGSLPTASNVPTLYILDEYGYIATDGMAVTAAQARGLGASFVFAAQDYAGFKRGNETEAEQILANTKIKIIMSLEDTQATWGEVAQVLGTEVSLPETDGYHSANDPNSQQRDLSDRGVSIKERSKVSLDDLRAQIEGEFHLFHKDNLIRGNFFHADPPIKKGDIQYNVMLEVERPSQTDLSRRFGAIRDLRRGFLHTLKAMRNDPKACVQQNPEDAPVDVRFAQDGTESIRGEWLDLLRHERLHQWVGRRDLALTGFLVSFAPSLVQPSTPGAKPAPAPDLEIPGNKLEQPKKPSPAQPAQPAQKDQDAESRAISTPLSSRWIREGWGDEDDEDDGSLVMEEEPGEDLDPDDEHEEGQEEKPVSTAPASSQEAPELPNASAPPPSAEDALNPLLESVRTQVNAASKGGLDEQSFSTEMRERLQDARYPETPVPKADMQRESRVQSMLGEFKRRGTKYNRQSQAETEETN